MKKLFSIIVLTLVLATSVFAQFTTGFNPEVKSEKSYLEITCKGVLDTAAGTYDSLASRVFSLADFDAGAYFTVYHKFTSATGAPNCLVDLYGSMDNTNFVLIEQLVDTTTSETATFAATTLSYKRALYYKLVIEQVASGRDNTAFDVRLLATKRDY